MTTPRHLLSLFVLALASPAFGQSLPYHPHLIQAPVAATPKTAAADKVPEPPAEAPPKSVAEARARRSFLPGVIVTNAPPLLSAEPSTAKPVPAPLDLSVIEGQMLEELNAFRARSGLRPLVPTANLMQRARGHANAMASRNSMYHSAGIQENVAYGTTTAKATNNMWINSGGHNANMRTSNPNVGLSVARGSSGTYYWVQMFANQTAAPPAPATSQPRTDRQPVQQPSQNFQRRGIFGRFR